MKLSNDAWMRAKGGLAVLQQTLMMRADKEPAAASRAMMVATVVNQIDAHIGAVRRNQELLLAQYGSPSPDPQGGTTFTLANAADDDRIAYGAAIDNLMSVEAKLDITRIEIYPLDLQNMQARPDALAAIQPVVNLVTGE